MTSDSKIQASLAVSPAARVSRTNQMIQRKCACGTQKGSFSGECAECRKKKLQPKLAIGSTADPLEIEADRVAERVLGSSSTRSPTPAATPAPVRVQKTSTIAAGEHDAAPESVERVIAQSGSRLDSHVKSDMEQRFGHDFSSVRIHTDSAAIRSARDVHATAYTVGNNIVFGAGAYSPQSKQGRHLIAHELTHVIQQRSGTEARVQRQPDPDVDVNKSGKFIEDTYSAGARQLNDPTLAAAASDVRNCREYGGNYCEILVTDKDIETKHTEWSVIEAVLGRTVADQAIKDHKLHEVAAQAAEKYKRDQEAAKKNNNKAGAGFGAMMMGRLAVATDLSATTASSASAGAAYNPVGGVAANSNLAVANSNIAVAETAVASEVTAAEGIAAAPKPVPAAGIGIGAGATLFIAFGVVVAVQLFALAGFQKKLFAAGYRFLPSPRGVCMRGCHQGTSGAPKLEPLNPEFLRPLNRPMPLTPLGPTSGPWGDIDIDDLTDFFPQPDAQPKLKPKKRRKRDECSIKEGFPRGGNPEHDELARRVTGSPNEWLLTNRDGKAKQYDGMDEFLTLYDAKTGHDFLRILGLPDMPLTFPDIRSMSNGVSSLRAEAIYERDVAQSCGYDFHIVTNNLPAVDMMREILGDILAPDQIEYFEMRWP